jgi:heme-degrading monooxygenase HmoA
MIARIWRGATRDTDADAYLDVLHRTGLSAYRATPGNRGVLALRRSVDGKAEFLLLTLWDSESAVRGFAGDDISRAVYYPEDEQFLVERGESIEHFEVVFRDEGGVG